MLTVMLSANVLMDAFVLSCVGGYVIGDAVSRSLYFCFVSATHVHVVVGCAPHVFVVRCPNLILAVISL